MVNHSDRQCQRGATAEREENLPWPMEKEALVLAPNPTNRASQTRGSQYRPRSSIFLSDGSP